MHDPTHCCSPARAATPAPPAAGEPAKPEVVDRAAYEAEIARLQIREKAHTREGDAIAAARRRLPMIELDPHTPLTGPEGPMTLRDAFGGRRQLIAYYFMWHPGRPAAQWSRIAAGRSDDLTGG